jgi:hypothetical protein
MSFGTEGKRKKGDGQVSRRIAGKGKMDGA